jgi:hypothetical protein
VELYATAREDDPDLKWKREEAVAAARRWSALKTEDDRRAEPPLWPAEEQRLHCLRQVP